MTLKSYKTLLYVLAVLAGISIIVFLGLTILTSLQYGTSMNTFPTDGTFQLYNPLRRITDGQLAGLDFPVFHGVGVPWLHLAVFELLGSNVFAAETAKWLVSATLFVACTLIFFFAYFRSIPKTLIATAIFIVIASYFIDVISPGGSLRGLRGTFPILVAAALIWKTDKNFLIYKFKLYINDILAILLIGVSFACGTEHGIATTIAYLIVKAFILWHRKTSALKWVVEVTLHAVLIALSILIFITALSGGHPIEVLKYALIDIPTDQGWYFGAPPNTYLTWGSFIPSLISQSTLAVWIIILLGLIAAYSLYKNKDYKKFIGIVFICIYGVIIFLTSVLSYYVPQVQLVALERGLGIFLVAVVIDITLSEKTWTIRKGNTLRKILIITPVILIAVLIINSIYINSVSIKNLPARSILSTSKQAIKENDYFASSPIWKNRIDAFEPYIKPNSTIWSTYTGLYESLSSQLGHSKGGEDYIIHVLGRERRANYVNDFISTKPDYVITLRPNFFYYEEWLWSTSGDFYIHLLTNYDLMTSNDSHYLWQKKVNVISQDKPVRVATSSHNQVLLPPTDSNTVIVYKVTLKYKTSSKLPLIGKSQKYLLYPSSISGLQYPISLPTNETTVNLIIPVTKWDINPNLVTRTDGIIPGTQLTIESAAYQEITLTESNKKILIDNYCVINKSLGLSMCS